MNYLAIYHNIIKNRISSPFDGYTERHHIVPKSLGGSDDPSNIVLLTAREHFLCHWLLVKIYKADTDKLFKMVKAFAMMCLSKNGLQDRKINSRTFEKYRLLLSQAQQKNQSGENNSQFGTKWVFNPELKQSKKISRFADPESGWFEGRKISFEAPVIVPKRDILCGVCNAKLVSTRNSHAICKSCVAKKKQGKACVVLGVEYDSVASAAKTLRKNDETIRRWITDNRNNSYYL